MSSAIITRGPRTVFSETSRGAKILFMNSDVESALDRLRNDHRRAEERLKELERHLSLSSEEQLEQARLKKQKLQLKDEIRSLSAKR